MLDDGLKLILTSLCCSRFERDPDSKDPEKAKLQKLKYKLNHQTSRHLEKDSADIILERFGKYPFNEGRATLNWTGPSNGFEFFGRGFEVRNFNLVDLYL